ncbi:hypothetical protein V2W30_35485 [Streptomyces sp. Q6]|uniref:Uncharacterized protein n=1 Tax=Streptomyces citrinus TaxID=3118173 RepID=A0ACD5AM38_9ACTN
MDTAKLELAAQRFREAEAALDAARADLRGEALAFLQDTDDRRARDEVTRITGWSRGQLRRLAKQGASGR